MIFIEKIDFYSNEKKAEERKLKQMILDFYKTGKKQKIFESKDLKTNEKILKIAMNVFFEYDFTNLIEILRKKDESFFKKFKEKLIDHRLFVKKSNIKELKIFSKRIISLSYFYKTNHLKDVFLFKLSEILKNSFFNIKKENGLKNYGLDREIRNFLESIFIFTFYEENKNLCILLKKGEDSTKNSFLITDKHIIKAFDLGIYT